MSTPTRSFYGPRSRPSGRGERGNARGVAGYVPPGWPGQVLPPVAEGFEASATAFLLDCCPPDYRLYPVLRRFPIVLARFAAHCVDAQVRASDAGLRECRAELTGFVPPDALDAAAEAWQAQGAALRRLQREVRLVEQALRGVGFVPRL